LIRYYFQEYEEVNTGFALTKCQHCGSALVQGMHRCRNPKCRQYNFGATQQSIEDSTVLLSDARLANVERVKTGLVDKVFGGGIGRTTVNLLGGEPGAGKTTLCLQLADIFCEQFPTKEALYIANEQDAPELKSTAERLNLRHKNQIRIVKAMGGISCDIGELLLHYSPCVSFLDSVTKWSGEDMRLAVVICQRLKDYTVRLNAPTLVVNQVTKGGDHAGLNQLQHAVDMTGMFDIILEEGEILKPDTPRRLMTMKNRWGPAPEEQYYRMTPTGLVEIMLDETSVVDNEDTSE
jgi:DNA repair protein RadA/Sms